MLTAFDRGDCLTCHISKIQEFVLVNKSGDTVFILNIWTDRLEQTVYTQIRCCIMPLIQWFLDTSISKKD